VMYSMTRKSLRHILESKEEKAMAMLEVRDLQVYYGMIHAIKGISFDVNQGEVIALIGANGAGKTTTLHTITGLLAPKSGSVLFEGKDITKVPAHKIVSMGMAHVPEGRRVFAELSVYENLKMGAYTRKDKKEIEESLANVYKRFPRLEERKNQMAGTLSGGEQQMLAMGRALMSKPKIILMDEPSMGLSPIFVNEIFDIIRAVSESGTTVLLVEQNAKKALSISDRAYVLETGTITMSGKAKDLLEDEAVKKAYLGE
jgi:branched-chain amino acid transport system ATP-binding protein